MKLEKVLKNTPRTVSLEMTYRCNLNCVYCTKRESSEGTRDISNEVLKKIEENLDIVDRIIICGIGESFLYHDIIGFVHKYKNKKFCIVTNGTILIDYKELNKFKNIEQIVFSVDATTKELMDTIGNGYNFDNLEENLRHRNFFEEGRKIQTVLNCTLNEYNIKEIPNLVQFAVKHRFNVIHYSMPRGREAFIRENMAALKKQLKYAAGEAVKKGIYFVDPFDVCCIYLNSVTPYITLNGDVFACAEALYIEQKLGNIMINSMGELLEGDCYLQFQNGQACKKCGFYQNAHCGDRDILKFE